MGNPEDYPPAKEQRVRPTVRLVTLVICHRTEVLLVRRPELGLWGGLWEPPTLTLEDEEDEEVGLKRLVTLRLGIDLSVTDATALPPFGHILSHRNLRFSPFVLRKSSVPRLRLHGYSAHRLIDPTQPQALGLSAWVTALLARLPEDGTRPSH